MKKENINTDTLIKYIIEGIIAIVILGLTFFLFKQSKSLNKAKKSKESSPTKSAYFYAKGRSKLKRSF